MSNDHDHHHHPNHDSHGQMPFNEKLLKMLNLWIKHNEDHALNYRNWAEKAKTNGRAEAGVILEKAAEMFPAISGQQQSWGYDDGPCKGLGPPLLVAAELMKSLQKCLVKNGDE